MPPVEKDSLSLDSLSANSVFIDIPDSSVFQKTEVIYKGHERVRSMRDDDGVFSFFVISGFFLILAFLRGRSYFGYLLQSFFRTKARVSMFVDSGLSNFRVNFILMANTIMMLALFAYCYFNNGTVLSGNDASHLFITLLTFTGIILLFYLLKFILFTFLSFIFFDKNKLAMWRDSYLFNLSFLGIIFFFLLLVIIYSNIYSDLVVSVFVLVFLFFRIVQLRKAFVIFITEFRDVFYFFLYLCAVEILPGLILYNLLESAFNLV